MRLYAMSNVSATALFVTLPHWTFTAEANGGLRGAASMPLSAIRNAHGNVTLHRANVLVRPTAPEPVSASPVFWEGLPSLRESVPSS